MGTRRIRDITCQGVHGELLIHTIPLNALMDEFYLLNYALDADGVSDLMNDISP